MFFTQLIVEGVLGSIRNRETAQHFRSVETDRKPAIKIAQNRKSAEHNDRNSKFTNRNSLTLDLLIPQ